MFSKNLRTMPLQAAIERTFSHEGRCAICIRLDSTKQQHESRGLPGPQLERDIVLVYAAAPTVVIAEPEVVWWISAEVKSFSGSRASPMHRPPRA